MKTSTTGLSLREARTFRRELLIAVLVGWFGGVAAMAQTNYELVHVFHPSGSPSKLIQATDGYFYGTTYFGGRSGVGTIFRMDAAGNLETVHSFAYADGANPSGGLVQGSDGNFYGTTTVGGRNNKGTVYRMDPSFHVAVLHSFDGVDGAGPPAAPAQTIDGNLYGTTEFGGAADQGTVWGIIDGNFTTLHSFRGEAQDGGHVRGALLSIGNGVVGTTATGGYDGFGTIFHVDSFGFRTWYEFTWRDLSRMPVAGLTAGYDGLYGTTTAGGELGDGTIFRYDGEVTTLHSFAESVDGYDVETELIAGLDGSFYGTSAGGGPTWGGTVFKINPGGEMTVLHSFDGTEGALPSAALLQTNDGAFYGATRTGDGWRWSGSIFRMHDTGDITTLHVFRGEDGLNPEAGLIEGDDGRLYGAAMGGEYNLGTVFSIDRTGMFTLLHNFDGTDGSWPRAGLLRTGDGGLYGTTSAGGESNHGTVFRMQQSGELTTIHSFDGADGDGPNAPIIQANDGTLYGTTAGGGSEGSGSVFRIDTAGAFSMLATLAGDDGKIPGPLVVGDQSLYGTAVTGGAYSQGTIFVIGPTGDLEACHAFEGPDGANPIGGMIRATDGNFYGMTYGGGSGGRGTVFRMNSAEQVSTVHSFQGDDGSGARAGLIQASDGNFYATTDGGTGAGTIFRMDMEGNVTTLHEFHATDGATPFASLLQASDGHIYGATLGGGPIFSPDSTVMSNGVVFRLGWSPVAVNLVTPSSGDATGAVAMNLLGGGFAPESVVTVGGAPGTEITVVDATFLYLFSPSLTPGTLNDVSVTSSSAAARTATGTLPNAFFADFLDLPQLNPFHDYVEKIFRNGITAGCAAGSYCPGDAVTRAQMAVFLLKSKWGSSFVPPACAGIFGDVPCPSLFADWIEQLAAEGITAGCGDGNYCPTAPVTRAQMSAFLLKSRYGSSYEPPPCAGVFGDVACPSQFADWIEQLAAEQITSGCGGGNFCPGYPNTRAQMSAFLVKTFGM